MFLKNENDKKVKQQKPKKKKLRQELTSHMKWAHSDLSLPFRICMERTPLPYK